MSNKDSIAEYIVYFIACCIVWGTWLILKASSR